MRRPPLHDLRVPAKKPEESKAVAVAFIIARDEDGDDGGADADWERLAGFRRELYCSLGLRRDALFDVVDAVLCKQERVLMLAELCLEPECRRGHGGVYDALNSGDVIFSRLRRAVPGLALPQWPDGRIRLACDVSSWLRPDAWTSPERLNCHVHGHGRNGQTVPGWPYSRVAALEPGRSSRALPLDAARLGPQDSAAGVTAAQVRGVIGRIIAAGHWKDGDPPVLVIFDAGYDLTRLAFLLQDLPVEVLGRLRSDRVMYFPPPPKRPGAPGRAPRHGARLALKDPGTWPVPEERAVTETSRYGTAEASAWGRVHQRLERQAAWEHHQGQLPAVEGTLIRLAVDRLPGQGNPVPVWLWSSRPVMTGQDVTLAWQSYLRRFDIEHFFRFCKQQLGWTAPGVRSPEAAGRWTWLVLAACAQLWLARPLAADTRLPWHRPCPPGRPAPSRVRRGFRRIHRNLPVPASPPKPSRPGPGRPSGSKNRRPAPRYGTGKNVKPTTAKAKASRQTG
jgi:DDE superfamily endonuclease